MEFIIWLFILQSEMGHGTLKTYPKSMGHVEFVIGIEGEEGEVGYTDIERQSRRERIKKAGSMLLSLLSL